MTHCLLEGCQGVGGGRGQGVGGGGAQGVGVVGVKRMVG